MKIDKKIIPYFTALITNIIFGLSFLFTKKALMVSNPITLVAFRFLLAFIIMSLLIAFKVIKVNYKNKPMKWLIVLAIIEPIIYFIFENSPAEKIVGEPDERVRSYEYIAQDIAFKAQKKIRMPEKNAILYYCFREEFYEKCGEYKSFLNK